MTGLFRRLDPRMIVLTAFLLAGCQSPDGGARSEGNLDRLRAKADRDNVDAQFELGRIYSTGDGVPRNDEEAFHWLRLAAHQGHAEAQYYLGILYKDGRGTAKNFVEAYKWFNLAAARGNPNAAIRMETVGRLMNREQIAEAQRAAMSFRTGKAIATDEQLFQEPLKQPDRKPQEKLAVPSPTPTVPPAVTHKPVRAVKSAAEDRSAIEPARQTAKPPVEKPREESLPMLERKVAKEPVYSPIPPPNQPAIHHEAVAPTKPVVKNVLPAKTAPKTPEQPEEKTAKKWWKLKKEPVYAPVPPPSGDNP